MKTRTLPLFEGSKRELRDLLGATLEKHRSFRLATVNSEYLLESRKNTMFRKNLEKADIRVCDGAGAAWWYRLRYGRSVLRFAGADLAWEMVRLVHERRGDVCLVTREGGLSTWQETATVLKNDFPGLEVGGVDRGIESCHCEKESSTTKQSLDYARDCHTFRKLKARNDKDALEIVQYISVDRPTLILCNFGMPVQEYFLEKLKKQKIPALMIGVGGAFDFWTGKQKRAPQWMRRLGLEWLWRFVHNPRRAARFVKRLR